MDLICIPEGGFVFSDVASCVLSRVSMLSSQSELGTEAEPPEDHPQRNLPGGQSGAWT